VKGKKQVQAVTDHVQRVQHVQQLCRQQIRPTIRPHVKIAPKIGWLV
jgi:hypothetical protein